MSLLGKWKKYRNNLKAIRQGWTNYIRMSPAIEKIANERANICAKCPNIQHSKWLQATIGEPIKEIEGAICGMCHCPLSGLCRNMTKGCGDKTNPRW